MNCCVAYDIAGNRLRLRIAKRCRKIGLLRMQKSLFLGRASDDDVRELEREMRPLLAPNDRLAIVALEKETFHSLIQQSGDARLLLLERPFVFWQF